MGWELKKNVKGNDHGKVCAIFTSPETYSIQNCRGYLSLSWSSNRGQGLSLERELDSKASLDTAMRKLVRKWRNYEDDKLFLPTRDDPAFDDSRPMDTQGLHLFFSPEPLNFNV